MSPLIEVKVEKNIANEIINFINNKPKYGYVSIEEFVRDSIRCLMRLNAYSQ